MPDRFGVPVVTVLVCFFQLHARLRAGKTPGIPCALLLSRATSDASPGHVVPRERGNSSLRAKRKQSMSPRDGLLRRFAPRNDAMLFDELNPMTDRQARNLLALLLVRRRPRAAPR